MSVKFFKNTLIPMLILVVGIAISLLVWNLSKNTLQRQTKLEFKAETIKVVDTINRHLERDVKLLYSLRGLFYSSQSVEMSEFSDFAKAVDLQKNYPGISTLGYQELVLDKDKEEYVEKFKKDTSLITQGFPDFKITPEGKRSEYVILKYGFPEEDVKSIHGFDLLTDSVRSRVALASRDSNLPLLSDLIYILPNKDPGFLIYLPVYKNDADINSLEARRENLLGYLTSVFKNKQFFENIGSELKLDFKDLDLDIYDAHSIEEISEKNLLFDFSKQGYSEVSNDDTLEENIILDIYGHNWILKFKVLSNYGLSFFEANIPFILLIFGIILTLLTASIVYSLLNARTKALKIASEMTRGFKESEEKFRLITESAKDSIVMMDNLGKVVFWNHASEELFGYKKEEIIGKDFHNLIPFEKVHREKKDNLQHFFQTGESEVLGKNVEVPIKIKSGEKRDVELTISRVKINDFWHAVGIMRDITERKKEADELKIRTEELEALNKNMIGRELKMVELKEQIEELKKKYDKK